MHKKRLCIHLGDAEHMTARFENRWGKMKIHIKRATAGPTKGRTFAKIDLRKRFGSSQLLHNGSRARENRKRLELFAAAEKPLWKNRITDFRHTSPGRSQRSPIFARSVIICVFARTWRNYVF